MGKYRELAYLCNCCACLGTKTGVCHFAGAICLVVSPAERERGGLSKLTEAMYELLIISFHLSADEN